VFLPSLLVSPETIAMFTVTSVVSVAWDFCL